MQVWVYEDAGQDGESNIYVHHDIMLPAFPLCLAWTDCRPSGDSEPANLAAVGAMSPGIEIWYGSCIHVCIVLGLKYPHLSGSIWCHEPWH